MKKFLLITSAALVFCLISWQSVQAALFFYDVEDTHIDGSTILGTNGSQHGSETTFKAYRNSHYWDESLIQVQGIFGEEADQVSLDDTIVSAKLHIVLTYSYGTSTNTFSLYQLTTAWDEDTVTSASFGRISGNSISTPVDTLSGPSTVNYSTDTEYIFDVTQTLLAWQSGDDNYGWGLTGSSANNIFFSSEYENASLRPFLEITLEETTGNPVPVPSSLLLLGIGLAGLLGFKRH